MHELSLCSSALEIMEQNAKAQGAKRITSVWIEIGALSCVEPDALEFCFELVCRDTMAQGCKLHIVQPDALVWCFGCNKKVSIKNAHMRECPECGSAQLQADNSASDQIQVKQMEIE